MNIQEYIESGILESYVLGATTQSESIEVERLAEKYPAIQLELMALEGTLENYALQYTQEPPSALKKSVMDAITKESALQDKIIIQENPIKVLTKNNTSANNFTWRIAASWVLLALSIGGNIWFFSNWKKSEEKVFALETQNQVLALEGQALKASYQEEVAILQNPNIKIITLTGQAIAPSAKALIYFDKTKQEVYLSALNLPVAPKGKQYQLWAIVDDKPVDAGMIEGNNNILKMKPFANAAAFAISLENTGGSTTEIGPKGAVYVVGAV
jgi:anti-sigma-K factor RskA